MKIAVRAGHNFQAKGASGIIDETSEARNVKTALVKYLKELGHDVLDVTPGNMSVNADLAYGVNRANDWGAQLFLSIHFNKAYHSYNGAIGTEGWVYSKGGTAAAVSDMICSKLESIGLKNRGTKTNGFYELRNTRMPAVIVEVCFVEATKDTYLYKTAGADKVGRLIAEGATNQTVNADIQEVPSNSKMYRCITGSFSDMKNAEKRVVELKNAGFDSFIDAQIINNDYAYKCVTGSFSDKNNAESRVDELKKKDFDSFIEIV